MACRADFDVVLRFPQLRFRRGPFVLMAGATDAASARLGLIVAKRVLRRAVDRNRAKRVIRESFRQHGDLPPLDVVVRLLVGSPPLPAQADRLFATLTTLWAERRHGH